MPPGRRRRRAAALGRRACGPASRGASAGCGRTTSTCSTCTSPTARSPLDETASAPSRSSSREGKIGALGVSRTSPPGRSPTSSRRATPSARRVRSSPSSSTTSWPAGSRRSTSSSPRRTGLAHHGLQPARRRPAHRPAPLRRERRPRAASARRLADHVHGSATGTPQLFAAIDDLGRIAAEAGISLAELSLRWLLSASPASGPCCSAGPKWSSCEANIAAAKPVRSPPTSSPPATPSAPASAARCPHTTDDTCDPREQQPLTRVARIRPRISARETSRRLLGRHRSPPVATERIARLGYDYVCARRPARTARLLGHARRADGHRRRRRTAVGMVRVEANDPTAIGKALDAGAVGVIVPLVNTAEDAAARGRRGQVPAARASAPTAPCGPRCGSARTRPTPTPPPWCFAMIETPAGLEPTSRRSAATPGLDGVYVGPVRPAHRRRRRVPHATPPSTANSEAALRMHRDAAASAGDRGRASTRPAGEVAAQAPRPGLHLRHGRLRPDPPGAGRHGPPQAARAQS